MTSEPAAARFPDTHWSLVRSGDRGVALEHLAAAYWRPVYGFVRAHGAHSEADALDATQEFFVRLVEGDLLARAEPGRGRFRAYLRVALAHFLADEGRRRQARKRGGDRRFVPLETDGLELPDTRGRAPDEALDQLWRAEVLERAAHVLREELLAEGKAKQWALFHDWFTTGEQPDQAELAERHGITRVDVSNWLVRSRARYREALIRIVRETVEDGRALADELAWLLGEDGA